MVASKRAHSTADPQVPEFDCVVLAGCQESVEGFVVRKAALVELDSVSVLEMTVVDHLNWFVDVGIVDHDLLIGAANDPDRRCDTEVMEAE